MKKFSTLYVKYIIKAPIVFYMFLFSGVVLFLWFSLSLKLDVVQSVTADIKENRVAITGEYVVKSHMIYFYSDRNEKKDKLKIEQVELKDGQTLLIINNIIGLSGEVQADIIIDSQTLFERIFIRAGKG